jgi:hypothetical protein
MTALNNTSLISFIKTQALIYVPNTKHTSIAFHCKVESNCILVDLNRFSANFVSKPTFKKMLYNHQSTVKFRKFQSYAILFCNIPYTPQSLVDSIPLIGPLIQRIKNLSTLVNGVYQNTDHPAMAAFFVDVISILADFFTVKTAATFITLVARIYSLVLRVSGFTTDLYRPQMDFSDLSMCLVALGLPPSIIQSCRDFQTFTNLRFTTGSFVVTCAKKLFTIIKQMLEFINNDTSKLILNYINSYFAYFNYMEYIETINDLYSKYVKDNQVMLDFRFREKVLSLDRTIGHCLEFNNWLSSPDRRAQKELYLAFKANLVKYASTYTTSQRKEPVCIVLEGPPGCRKSDTANKFISFCNYLNRSVYTHTCPSVEDGKDFYDDYENQSIFVMDDVGQQGNSQWRNVINFVSPVKFPLSCAAVEKKNTKFFNSEVVICTTNQLSSIPSFTSKDCIGDREALFRRCHVLKFKSITSYDVEYIKFDYSDTHRWVHEFIGPLQGLDVSTSFKGDFNNRTHEKDLISWIYKIMSAAERANNDASDSIFSETDFDDMATNLNLTYLRDEYTDASTEFAAESYFTDMLQPISLFTFDWTTTISEMMSTNITSVINQITQLYAAFSLPDFNNVSPSLIAKLFISVASISLLGIALKSYMSSTSLGELDTIKGIYTPESMLTGDDLDRIKSVQDHTFLAKVTSFRDGVKVQGLTQIIISGKYFILNDHSIGDNPSLNVYKRWIDYENNNMLFNNLPLTFFKRLIHEDLAIYYCEKFPISPISIFKWPCDEDINFYNTKFMYVVNSDMCKPLILHGNGRISNDVVEYKISDNIKYSFPVGETIKYDLSAQGLCGSLLVTPNGVPLGHHVAGNSEQNIGVIKIWSKETLKIIRSLHSNTVRYPVINKDLSQYSGLRLHQTDLKSSRIPYETSYFPSPMHAIDSIPEYVDAREQLEQLPMVIEKMPKLPVNLSPYGSKTIYKRSEKSFKPIPSLPQYERDFAKLCLRSMLIKFSKVTEHEAAFGNDILREMNRKSVNGYGYTKNKTDYFDYDNKTIKPEFLERLYSFKQKIATDTLLPEDILCTESLKDELRPLPKVDKPRCYRILPLHHTFLVKQYLAPVFLHILENMWDNGIAIGMNPYQDFNKLYAKLKTTYGHFDGDFGDYDGSAPSELQDDLAEVVNEFFDGSEEDRKVLKTLLDSLIRSFVLTKEELRLTTHSLPSGCWVTALFNSFLNRMLTAVCLIRNKPTATLLDFHQIIDFVLGDDKIVGTPKHLANVVNALTMRDLALSIGMTYTDAKKGEITTPFKALDDCQFLKRTFKFHSQLAKVVGILDINTIFESLRFYDSTKELNEVMNGKMTAVQFELYLYGHEGLHIKDIVMRYAEQQGVEFKRFNDLTIQKSMLDPKLYQHMMIMQSKYFA